MKLELMKPTAHSGADCCDATSTPLQKQPAAEQKPMLEKSSHDDPDFVNWLSKQFETACKREHRWKPHIEKSHARYEYTSAIRMKRCIRMAAAYEAQAQVFQEAINDVGNILGALMGRNELAPGIYQQIMERLYKTDARRN